ncbi:MAG TPA: SMC family ATPase [Anaerolineales bacterium]|jgi:exonuclease SbcC
MIPLSLKLSGFLSYHDPVEVDFSTFELACISGQNGAGKSSLLDAITWVLFGQARKRDETLINTTSDKAEVTFVFEYEQNIYRVQRTLARGKTTVLEFQIRDGTRFKPFTEDNMRATQARIESILRLDYDTFVNASFFLQGKADQFTQQRPTDRKRILSSILGLELWETYRERTAERRKVIENEVTSIEGRMSDINAELAEEPTRKARLKELESDLAHLVESRRAQERVMSTIKQALEGLKRQQDLVEKLGMQITRENNNLNAILARRSAREGERSQHLQIVANSAAVESSYQAWLVARADLEKWEKLAESFREQEKVRQEPLARIGAEQARLEQERDSLLRREKEIAERIELSAQLETDLHRTQGSLKELQGRLKEREELAQSKAIITRFHEQERLRQVPLGEINTEKARLEQELRTLEKQNESVGTQRSALKVLASELAESQAQLDETEIQLQARKDLESQAQQKKEQLLLLKSSNERLKFEMVTLDERIKKLKVTEGALCPLCGQPLSPEDRQRLVSNLTGEGQEKGSEFRQNKAGLENLNTEITGLEKEIAGFSRVEKDYLFHVTSVTKITERLQTNTQAVADWEVTGAGRMAEVRQVLADESFCALARQNLARIERELQAIGKALGVKSTSERSIYESVEEKVVEIEARLEALNGLDEERLSHNTHVTRLNEQINNLKKESGDWLKTGKPRLGEINELLSNANYSLAERQKLAEIDAQLKLLGYDAAEHDAVRRAEQAGRSSENNLRELEAARAALLPLERELTELENQAQALQVEIEDLKNNQERELRLLEELKASIPDLDAAERTLLNAQESENILTREVGAAQQKVRVLSDVRTRKASLEAQREELAIQIKHHKTLERAFGKDGVPALLIEQALPQIQEKANELLDRLSNGTMSVRFETQTGYRDKNRKDLRETLDILISDGAGTRDYEMFSGGEAFRVNFAIRLALSEILARRTGARLQTLVIDEGFGSQDALGRQRLIEAINQVKGDFAKILIITHLEELKDAFPNRIEVEKTPTGSSVRVW